MYGRLVGLCTTLESSRSSSLAPFIVLRSIPDFLMNAIQYLFGWQLRFGLPPAVHRFLSHTVLLLLLSLYLPILLKFFLLPLLIVLSPFLFLSPLLLSCSFSCTFCSFLLLFSGPSGTRTYYLSPTHRPLFAYSLVVFVWKPRSTAVDPGVIY